MDINLSKLPNWVKLEVSKADLIAFANTLSLNQSSNRITDENELLTIDEAANFLKLARQTVYGLTSKRAIPFFKRNKRLYFKKTELLKWIEEGRKKTQVEFDEEIANFINRKNQKQ